MSRFFPVNLRLRSVFVAVLTVAAGALAVLEGWSAPTPVFVVGIAVCGLLAVASLHLPGPRPVVVAGLSALSAGFSVLSPQLAVRADNTFGILELVALALLSVRVVLHHPFWRTIAMFAAITVAVAVLPLRLDEEWISSESRVNTMVLLTLGMAFTGLAALYLRLRDRMRADRFEFDRQAQRLEYARDLHDFVAHHVTAIVAQTKAVRYTTAAGLRHEPEELDRLLAGIEEAGSEALTSMRGMISVLRHGSPVPTRPQSTLAQTLTEITARFAAIGPQTTVTVDDRIAARQLPDATVSAARHVVQESLTNVLRHAADVTRVVVAARIRADDPDLIEVTVSDDGRPHDAQHTPGFGLIGLNERAGAIGGHCVGERRDGGWRVTAVLPMTAATPALPSWRA